jgi:hypothetical protein
VLGLHTVARAAAYPSLWPGTRALDLVELLAGSLLWILITVFVLEKTGSALPRVAMQRLKLR